MMSPLKKPAPPNDRLDSPILQIEPTKKRESEQLPQRRREEPVQIGPRLVAAPELLLRDRDLEKEMTDRIAGKMLESLAKLQPKGKKGT
jgi:hypothetical protein